MGNNPSKRQQLVAALLKKFPDAGHRTLAKRLHDEHPLLFPSVENARTNLRQYTGNHGGSTTGGRRQAIARGTYRPPRKPGELPPLPKSEAKPWEPYVLECKRCLILGDLHLNHHDPQAVEAALRYGVKYDPDTILLNGDVFDFHGLSKFSKDPSKQKLKDEIEAGHQFFTHLRARFKKARIVFRYGNHDRRWDKYLWDVAPTLWDALPSLQNIWHKDAGIVDSGTEVICDKTLIMLGKLPVLHGDELPGGSSPVNPARGAFIKSFEAVYVNHFHQQSVYAAKTISGKPVQTYSAGCLCGTSPQWLPINQWSSGFGTVDVEKNGHYRVLLHRIIDGEIY